MADIRKTAQGARYEHEIHAIDPECDLFANGLVALLSTDQSQAAIYTRTINSIDRIVGQTQGTGLPLAYTEDTTTNLVGRSGSSGNRYDSNIIFGYTLPTLARR